jgi:hypothetical protein
MTERVIGEEEFNLAARAADAVMGRDQCLPLDLAEGADDFVQQNPYFSGLVHVVRDGDGATMTSTHKGESCDRRSGHDFRFGESVVSDVRRNRTTASGQHVK